MKKRSVMALLLVLAMVTALFAGCGSSAPSSAAPAAADSAEQSSAAESAEAPASNGKLRNTTSGKADNSLTTFYTGTVSTIDPELFTAQDEDTVLSQIYEPLFLYNNQGELDPVLAESWTVNDDGSVDFVLRSGVKFHSGATLTSDDVLYTMSRIEKSPLCSALYGNVEMTVTDDTHFTWTFPNKDAGASFDDLAGYAQALCIVSRSYGESVLADPNDNLEYNEDGTGPYIFGGIEGNGDITLTKFDGYWGDVSIDTVYFKHLTGSVEYAFESGDLDVAYYTIPDNYNNIIAYDNVQGVMQPVNRFSYITLRSGEGDAFEDLALRQAVVYAINREDLAYVGSDGTGQTAYNLATPLIQYYADNADHFERDVEKSKELLSAAGYSESNPMPVTLVAITSGATAVATCEIMKEELEESYFAVNIEETPDMNRIRAGDFDITVSSIGLLPSFGSYVLMYQVETGLDLAGVTDQAILDAFAAAKDKDGFQNAMKVTTEALHYIPLYYYSQLLVGDGDLNMGEFNVSLTCYLFREFSWK